MKSIVLDLQQEVISQECDIIQALRKAHLIAAKLGLNDFDKWICNELNGYANAEDCPEYRTINCELKALNPYRGWIPIVIDSPKIEKTLNRKIIIQSLSEIVSLTKNSNGNLTIHCSGKEQEMFNMLSENTIPMQFAYHVSPAAVADIIEKVKNTLLEWTIQLEKEGIQGEGMVFNDKEKEQAKSVSQTINYYYGNTNVVNGQAKNSPVIAGNNNDISITMEQLKDELSKCEELLKKDDKITPDNIETALEILEDIRDKIDSGKKRSIIRAGLVGLKDFLMSAGGSLVANFLYTLITQL